MVKKKGYITNYTTMIATIATAVLAITALITVYITISAWREEREANRPYFTFKESPQVVITDIPQFEIKFTNVGEHPAVDLWSKSIVVHSDLQADPIAVDEYALVNDIPKNASATLLIELDRLRSEMDRGSIAPHFFVIALRYADPIIDKQFEQTLYIKWNGIDNGRMLPTNHAEEPEKTAIEKYFSQNKVNFK